MSEKDRQISKVAILGSEGVIGTVLKDGLKDFKLTSLDLPEIDARDYKNLLEHIQNQDAIINLALNPKGEIRENARNDVYSPDNSVMTYNVFRAAKEVGVKRVIMASSVHADNFYDWKSPRKLSTNKIASPTTPYGANKIFMEALGRYYAREGLEVICVRFGGVNPANKQPKDDFWESAVWLSHEDAIVMMNACLQADSVPKNFALLYAVSNNKGKIHDTSNPFGWTPK